VSTGPAFSGLGRGTSWGGPSQESDATSSKSFQRQSDETQVRCGPTSKALQARVSPSLPHSLGNFPRVSRNPIEEDENDELFIWFMGRKRGGQSKHGRRTTIGHRSPVQPCAIPGTLIEPRDVIKRVTNERNTALRHCPRYFFPLGTAESSEVHRSAPNTKHICMGFMMDI